MALTQTDGFQHHQPRLDRLERERKEASDARQAVWVFLWTLFVFKIATMGIILYVSRGSAEAQALAYASTWFWLIIPAAAIAGPVMYRRRLIQQRRRREALRRSEWDVPATPQVQVLFPGDDPPNGDRASLPE